MYECINCGAALRFDIDSQQLHCDYCDSDFDPQTYRVNEETGPGSYTMEVDQPAGEFPLEDQEAEDESAGNESVGTGSAVDESAGTGSAVDEYVETESAGGQSLETGSAGDIPAGDPSSEDVAARTEEKPRPVTQTYRVCVYTCPNCGGELLTTDEAITGFCPYCGSFAMLTKKLRQETRPMKIIPFKQTKEDCKKAYKSHTRAMIYTPRKMKDAEALETFRPIYMPFWMYNYSFAGDYRLVGVKEYSKGKYDITEYHRLTGHVESNCRGVFHDASSSLDDEISRAVLPYDTEDMKDFQPSYLCGFYADSGDVDSKVYQEEADKFAMDTMVTRLGKEVVYEKFDTVRAPGNKPVAKDLAMTKEEVSSVLLPVWFLTYRKDGRVAYSVVNGQTGKVTADLPVDIGRFLIGSLVTALPFYWLLNLFLAVIPRYLLAFSGLPALLVAAVYMIAVNSIYERDHKLNDAGITSLWSKKKMKEEKEKKETVDNLTTVAVLGMVIMLILWGVCIFTEMRMDSWLSSLVTIIAAGVMIAGVPSGLRYWDQKRLVNDSYVLLAAIILSRLLLLVNPHDDIYYYAGTIILYGFILYTLIQLIREYNLITTRPLPQFDRQGGDTSAPV